MKLKIENSKGNIYYGMHFYPGVAEYAEEGKEPYRVFLNEDTLRSMDPTFAGRPIFVEHVSEVDENVDELRKEADGWVVESFFNSADGKHWVKFIVVSERGERAIKKGLRLSNAYIPKSFKSGGLWNGVSYVKEITAGEFEHLAIVKNPRYEESKIMTPEEFKQYNENNVVELRRLANSRKESDMSVLKFFKRSKVENAIDGDICVTLPKSKKEMSVTDIVTAYDEILHNGMADTEKKVKLSDGSTCTVSELIEKHDELVENAKESEKEVKEDKVELDVEGDKKNDEDDMDDEDMPMDNKKKNKKKKNEDDEDMDDKKKSKKENDEDDEDMDDEKAKKKNAKQKADRLRNAGPQSESEDIATVDFSVDQVARGKQLFGS